MLTILKTSIILLIIMSLVSAGLYGYYWNIEDAIKKNITFIATILFVLIGLVLSYYYK